MNRAAVGFSVHTGWAASVAVVGRTVVDRRRIELIGDDPAEPRFVYHAARLLTAGEAPRFVARLRALAHKQAAAALREMVDELAGRSIQVCACAIIGRCELPGDLDTILASHPMIHTAEGALFRAAFRAAAEKLELPVLELPARELPPVESIADIGAAAGRPWAKDQRDACLAALVALSAGRGGAARRRPR